MVIFKQISAKQIGYELVEHRSRDRVDASIRGRQWRLIKKKSFLIVLTLCFDVLYCSCILCKVRILQRVWLEFSLQVFRIYALNILKQYLFYFNSYTRCQSAHMQKSNLSSKYQDPVCIKRSYVEYVKLFNFQFWILKIANVVNPTRFQIRRGQL